MDSSIASIEERRRFFDAVDSALLSGASPYRVAARFGLRERGVRRRKAALRASGHRFPRVLGDKPGVNREQRKP